MTTIDDLPNPLLPLEDEIQRFETEPLAWLGFEADLETRFVRETAAPRARSLTVQGLFALLAYDCFIVGDFFMDPAHIGRAAITRFGVITPLVLLVALAVRGRRSTMLRESAACFLCLAGTLSILYLHHNVDAAVSSQAQTGLILVLLVANCMLRIDLVYALVLSGVIMGCDLLWLYVDVHLSAPQKMVSGGMLAWVALLTLIANYSMARERRFSYLLQLRGRLQRGMLADVNSELMALSATDRLTGLPNRRAYDHRLNELWALSLERKEPISAIMVDVDHFKRLNDSFGHPYGDRVLQRIASLLQQALRAEDDFVARYGGEEFVVLLPNADPDSAFKVAERIRTLVEVAGSPALQRDSNLSPQTVWATVSCGIATSWPQATTDAARLISDADTAMYHAKQSGRNRVCSAPAQTANSKVTIFPSAGRA